MYRIGKLRKKRGRVLIRLLIYICKAILVDLKRCINNVLTNQPFPGRREDFPTQQAYENWQRREKQQLTELMNTLMLMKPNLALNPTSETDVGFSNLLAGESLSRSRNSIHGDEPSSPVICARFLCFP